MSQRDDNAKRLVQEAGAIWVGIQEGFHIDGEHEYPALLMFSSPSGSNSTVPLHSATLESIQEKIKSSDKKLKRRE